MVRPHQRRGSASCSAINRADPDTSESINRVDNSITERCIAIDHAEIVKTGINPTIFVVHCAQEPADSAASGEDNE